MRPHNAGALMLATTLLVSPLQGHASVGELWPGALTPPKPGEVEALGAHYNELFEAGRKATGQGWAAVRQAERDMDAVERKLWRLGYRLCWTHDWRMQPQIQACWIER